MLGTSSLLREVHNERDRMSLDSPELGWLAWVFAPLDWALRNWKPIIAFLIGFAAGWRLH